MTNGQAVVKTSYRRAGAGDLMDYIEQDSRDDLRDHTGETLDADEREAFENVSERHEFTREFIISPENGDQLDDREMSRQTRATMSDTLDGRPNTSYVYGIHRDTDNPHVHVAATGPENSLYMDRDDLDDVREHSAERFVEQGREDRLRHGQQRDGRGAPDVGEWAIEQEEDQEREQVHDRGPALGGGR